MRANALARALSSSLDRLPGGASPEARQHMVGQHRRPVGCTELASHQFVEFGQPH